MTTNGYSVAAISDADLAAFKDIEFSLDYPTEAEQDQPAWSRQLAVAA